MTQYFGFTLLFGRYLETSRHVETVCNADHGAYSDGFVLFRSPLLQGRIQRV